MAQGNRELWQEFHDLNHSIDGSGPEDLEFILDWLLIYKGVKVKFKVIEGDKIAATCPECFRGEGKSCTDAALSLAIALLKGERRTN